MEDDCRATAEAVTMPQNCQNRRTKQTLLHSRFNDYRGDVIKPGSELPCVSETL